MSNLNNWSTDESQYEGDEGDGMTLRDWLEAQPTREMWLMERVLANLTPIFADAGYTVPPVRVSCGWTGAGMEGCTLGICFDTNASAAHINEIFVSPAIDDAAQVLGVLMHELAHAVAGVEHQHDATYVEVCEKVGLTVGLPNQAQPGPELTRLLAIIARESDAYPHAKVTPPPPTSGGVQVKASPTEKQPSQETRLLKATCPSCGYVVRVTMKWASRGLPYCGAHEQGETHQLVLDTGGAS